MKLKEVFKKNLNQQATLSRRSEQTQKQKKQLKTENEAQLEVVGANKDASTWSCICDEMTCTDNQRGFKLTKVTQDGLRL